MHRLPAVLGRLHGRLGHWRKRVGVEPTKSRLATLSGFEGQPPHRERFPSAADITHRKDERKVPRLRLGMTILVWRKACVEQWVSSRGEAEGSFLIPAAGRIAGAWPAPCGGGRRGGA